MDGLRLPGYTENYTQMVRLQEEYFGQIIHPEYKNWAEILEPQEVHANFTLQ